MSLLKWRIHAENKYSHLLAALLTIFVASPFIPDIDVRFPVVTFIFYLAIILTLRALELRKNIFWGLVLAGGAAFGGEVFLDVFAKISFKEGLALCSMLIYVAFTLV
ncbi:MAG TPA: hypothetical protein PKL97_08105, partial [Candidatus Omnitrophota bacterium]|nr:hypothetical protein [Candidatus Omnitrophota bacterium]